MKSLKKLVLGSALCLTTISLFAITDQTNETHNEMQGIDNPELYREPEPYLHSEEGMGQSDENSSAYYGESTNGVDNSMPMDFEEENDTGSGEYLYGDENRGGAKRTKPPRAYTPPTGRMDSRW